MFKNICLNSLLAVDVLIAVSGFYASLVSLIPSSCGYRVSPHGVVPIISRFGFELLWLGVGVSGFGLRVSGFVLGVSEVMHLMSGYDFLRFTAPGVTNFSCYSRPAKFTTYHYLTNIQNLPMSIVLVVVCASIALSTCIVPASCFSSAICSGLL